MVLKDAIPYDEVEANPYTVLVTTSAGGHLSWFELNGERWFARTVSPPLDNPPPQKNKAKNKIKIRVD